MWLVSESDEPQYANVPELLIKSASQWLNYSTENIFKIITRYLHIVN